MDQKYSLMQFSEFKKLSNVEELILRIGMARPIGYGLARSAFWDILNDQDEISRRHYMAMTLNGMLARQSSTQEVAGLLDAIFQFDNFDPLALEKVSSDSVTSITLAGSGKKGFKTVNITSLTAFVLACMDVSVIKICAPSTSSMSGSQDFIEKIGANLAIKDHAMRQIMEKCGIGYFSVMSTLPKFSSVYTGHFYSPHILIFAIAPLAAPFITDRLFFGLAHPDSQLALELMQLYDRPSAFTIGSTYDGIHFIDEASSLGGVYIDGYADIRDKRRQQNIMQLSNISNTSQAEAMRAIAQCDNNEQNIVKGLSGLAKPESILAGEIALNAATMLHLCGSSLPLENLYAKCRNVILSGEPLQRIQAFVAATGGDLRQTKKYIEKARVYAA